MDRTLEKMKSKRGVALLITLSIITILVTAGLELNRRTKATAEAAAALKERFTLTQMDTGAIHLAMAMLIKDAMETKVDSVQEDWADPEKIEQMLADFPFEGGKVSLLITDELSRIQVNALVNFPDGTEFNTTQKDFWERFLEKVLKLYKETGEGVEMEETDPETILNCLKDWMDTKSPDAIEDGATGLSGAESDYYMGLDPPYKCKNGPFTHIGEVALVKGIPPELFYGKGELLGLSNYLTVYGATSPNGGPPEDVQNGAPPPPPQNMTGSSQGAKFSFEGRININTAELPVLMAILPGESADFAKILYEYRLIKKQDGTYANDLSNPDWYKNVPGFANIEIKDSLITTKSDFFRITATASRNKAKQTISVVVHREKNGKSGKMECKILNWQTE